MQEIEGSIPLESRPFFPIEQLSRSDFDVLIIGSGPAGVATAERVYRKHPSARIGILERGPVLLPTHFYNLYPDLAQRDRFIAKYKYCPWEGTLEQGGGILPTLGGRGLIAGAHLRRFDPVDLELWPNGKWPIAISELEPYFREVEKERHVSVAKVDGPLQDWVLARLAGLRGAAPPTGADLRPVRGLDVSRGFYSPTELIWKLAMEDAVSAQKMEDRRLRVTSDACATRLE